MFPCSLSHLPSLFDNLWMRQLFHFCHTFTKQCGKWKITAMLAVISEWITNTFLLFGLCREWKATSVTCVHESSPCLPTWRGTCSSTTASDPSSVTSASKASSRNRPSRRTWSSTYLSSHSSARWVFDLDWTPWRPKQPGMFERHVSNSH